MIISELDDGGGCELLNVSMQDARKLAQALLQAADEIDRWATTLRASTCCIRPRAGIV